MPLALSLLLVSNKWTQAPNYTFLDVQVLYAIQYVRIIYVLVYDKRNDNGKDCYQQQLQHPRWQTTHLHQHSIAFILYNRNVYIQK